MLNTTFNKTNPIPARPTANRQQPKAQKRETNPIPVPLASRRPPHPPLRETNPIAARPTTQIRETNPISTPQHPDYAKRTQFPHVSSLAFRISSLFRISSFGFRISPTPSGCIMRNEPKKTSHAAGLPPLYLTPTEVGDTSTTPNPRNKPNLPHPHHPIIHDSLLTIHYIYETNPIAALRPNYSRFTTHHSLYLRNEPNFRSASCLLPIASCPFYTTGSPNTRNEPNSHIPGVQPPAHTPLLHETNPIYPTTTIPLFTIHCSPFTIFTKQTQLPPCGPTIHDSPLTIHYIYETNPIPRTAGVSPAFPVPRFYETNPITSPL